MPSYRWFAMLGALAALAGEARAEVGLAPRIALGGLYVDNYAYAGTAPVAAAGGAGEAGLSLYWLPDLRHRVVAGAKASVEAAAPFVVNAQVERDRLAEGRLGWSWLASLRTRLDLDVTGYAYRAPAVFDARKTRGAEASAAFGWRAHETLEAGLAARAGADQDDPAALSPRDERTYGGEARLRWAPHWRAALETSGGWSRTASTAGDYENTALGGGARLELAPWRSGRVVADAALRRRDYVTARRDDRLAFGAAFVQRIGDWQQISLSGRRVRNESNFFPYERTTARLQWEFEPDIWL